MKNQTNITSIIKMVLTFTATRIQGSMSFLPAIHRSAVGGIAKTTAATTISKSVLHVSTAAKLPIMAEESVMSPKAHGTSDKPVQKNLRWNCDYQTADRICNFNRHYAEYAGYWTTTTFLKSIKDGTEQLPIKFYDSVTGRLLFQAPIGRTIDDFLLESQKHGWPSFRDEEVVWDDVRCLKNGECISTTGTHLGHNLPDSKGNRYCINLVSVAGVPEE
jgi:hypothetical protein